MSIDTRLNYDDVLALIKAVDGWEEHEQDDAVSEQATILRAKLYSLKKLIAMEKLYETS